MSSGEDDKMVVMGAWLDAVCAELGWIWRGGR